jgi:hypothetical protein
MNIAADTYVRNCTRSQNVWEDKTSTYVTSAISDKGSLKLQALRRNAILITGEVWDSVLV